MSVVFLLDLFLVIQDEKLIQHYAANSLVEVLLGYSLNSTFVQVVSLYFLEEYLNVFHQKVLYSNES